MTKLKEKAKNFTGLIHKVRLLILVALVILVVISLSYVSINYKNLSHLNRSTATAIVSGQTTEEKRITIPSPKATFPINKEFNFPIKDDKGIIAGNIKYIIDSAELRNEILVKGQKATAIAGKTFLIINLKLINNENNTIKINARDYLRLEVDNNKEWLAPDIHNDPVEVQAISTKYTAVGFPINENDKNLKLQVGEITGEKTVVELHFN